MRSLVIALAVVALMFGFAYADQTSGATYTSPNEVIPEGFIDYINTQEYIDHTHDVDLERDPELGLGIDLVIWQNKKEKQLVEEVVIQGKHDFNNNENSAYVVARVNLFNLTSKKTEPAE